MPHRVPRSMIPLERCSVSVAKLPINLARAYGEAQPLRGPAFQLGLPGLRDVRPPSAGKLDLHSCPGTAL